MGGLGVRLLSGGGWRRRGRDLMFQELERAASAAGPSRPSEGEESLSYVCVQG